jgi:O-succinylbenzoate synthase
MKVSLYQDDVTLARAIVASAQSHEARSRLFLVLEHEGVTGYGEIAPQPTALNGDPGLEEVIDAIEVVLARFGAVVSREGDVPSWSRVSRLAATTPAALFAVAVLEMAVLDRELRASGRTIGDLWPREHVARVQSTVSLLDDAEWNIDDRAVRVRVKSAPGALSTAARERLASLRVPVLLDFNCSATSDNEVLEQADAVRRVAALAAVEQPYDAGNLVDHARLAARLDVTLSLDEGIRKLSDVTNVAKYGAAGLLCIKPARVGGLANARTMITRAGSLGLSAYLGGFFESPYARFVHRSLVENCVDEPSDVGDVAVEGGASEVRVIAGGFGLEPSPTTLERAHRRLEFLEGGS